MYKSGLSAWLLGLALATLLSFQSAAQSPPSRCACPRNDPDCGYCSSGGSGGRSGREDYGPGGPRIPIIDDFFDLLLSAPRQSAPAPDPKVAQYKGLIDQAEAARRAGNLSGAIDYAKRALSLYDRPELRAWIASAEAAQRRNEIFRQANQLHARLIEMDKAGRFEDALNLYKQELQLLGSDARPGFSHDVGRYEAYVMWRRGLDAQSAGNTAQALNWFRAMRQHPDGELSQSQLEYVNNLQARYSAQQHEAQVSQSIYKAAADARQRLTLPSKMVSDLQIAPIATPSTGSTLFGSNSVQNPNLGPDKVETATANSAFRQASAIYNSMKTVPEVSHDPRDDSAEKAKAAADCGWPRPACKPPDPVSISKATSQTPAAQVLRARIPPEAFAKAPAVAIAFAHYDQLEKLKAGIEFDVAKLDGQIAEAKNDPSKIRILEIEKTQKKEEVKRATRDQANDVAQIQTVMGGMNMTWIPEKQADPEPAAPAKPGGGSPPVTPPAAPGK